jgi:uncharacterized repeat protein (TIGR01451 family)
MQSCIIPVKNIYKIFSFIFVLNLCGMFARAQDEIYFDEEKNRNTSPLPKGTKFVDMWGYPWVNNSGGGGSTDIRLTDITIFQCNTFRLVFGDVEFATGKGFADPAVVTLAPGHPLGSSTTLGALRRWTACEVFNYISQTITVPGGASAPDIYIDVSQLDGTGALGFATPFFSTSANPVSFNGGLLNEHIITGTDPTPAAGDYDAKMTFDFGPNNAWPANGQNIPINSDAFNTNAAGIDLFSVILHEATHALGFFSSVQSNGNSVVTNSSPGMYSLFDRYILNNANANIINNSTFAFQGGVAQLTSNALKYFKSTNTIPYSVYSPPVWRSGSSLSHFDDLRDNNAGYVMTASYSGGLKRTYTKGELEVLCNLGYTLTVSGFSCSDRYAVGVNDNATTSLTAPVSVNVIANDYDPDGQAIALDAASVTLLTNAGTVSTSGNNIIFTPGSGYCGPVLIRYRPYTIANGFSGSYAILTVNITCPNYCPADPCNLICNGGFETFTTLPTNFQTNYNPSIFPPWRNSVGSPDYFHRNTPVSTNFSIPVNFFAPSPGVNTRTLVNNNAYTAGRSVSGNDIEGLSILLSTPLVAGQQYTLTYWARANPYGVSTACTFANVRTSFSITPPSYNIGGGTSNFNGTNLNVASIPKIDVNVPPNANNNWTLVTSTFTAAANSLFLIVEPEYNPTPGACAVSMKFDDFRLVRVGNQISTSVTASTPNPRVGQNVVFTINVCNNGTTTVNNVGVTNLLPAGFNLVSSTFSAYPNHTIASLAAGACVTLTVTAQAQSSVALNTDLNNCVSITTANACAQTQSCATVRVLATDVSVSAAPQTCSSFRVTISNIGTVAAHNVKVDYTPPSCFGYSAFTVITGTASYSANQVNIPLIAPGASVVVEFTGSAAIPPNCINNISLTSAYDEWDLNLNNNAATVTMPGPGCTSGPCINLPRTQ